MASGSKSEPNLTALHAAVAGTIREQRRVPTPEEEGKLRSYPLIFYIEEDSRGRKTLWGVVRDLLRLEPDLYNRFVGERFLADNIIDLAEAQHPISWSGLVDGLTKLAESQGEWLVGVPLANLRLPTGYVELSKGVGAGMTTQERDWDRDGETPIDPFVIQRHLGDRFSAGVRWRREQDRHGPLDTRRTAVLYTVERGTQTLAVSLAMARARYALALWTLFRRPDGFVGWPNLANWEPRPYMRHGVEHKLYEPGVWVSRERVHGRSITEFSEYEPPSEPELLSAPFEAMCVAAHRLSARALISAAWSLHLVEREPNDLQRTDRLLLLATAIEALTDDGAGVNHDGPKRWARITHKLGTWRDLRGPYDQREIKDAQRLAKDLRNITAHGSDDVLVNLDYPPAQIRTLAGGRQVKGRDLALARTSAAAPVLHVAVRSVLETLGLELVKRDWDDAWFEAQFR